ncbi:DUF433 domain-containing protein [Flavisolibacter ginsenosidimutans]|uniref:DUF433 domain-containing protein n=1 Tax=Flavisolibacter ginsenosidimutans TaxID=661481 RepID=A0A5B8ULB8_9BACT|nr:DUF433 domain-containing protein [Flavisolibacter ginsenosidimutans]QEC56979.1 DUF433 domain-containing protein [Flavisolibacter ginsenosidimutans]
MNWRGYLDADPTILFGKLVVRNTRIPVDLLLEKMAAGDGFDDLLKAYPRLSREALQACLLFTASR